MTPTSRPPQWSRLAPRSSALLASLLLLRLAPDAAPAAPALTLLRSNSAVVLRWDSQSGASYQIQKTARIPAGPWLNAGTVLATGPFSTWTDPVPLGGIRFYRLMEFTTPTGAGLYEPPQRAPAEPCSCTDCLSGRPVVGPQHVHLFSGEFTYAAEDLRIKGRGLDFVWARRYRSRTGPDTVQGNGWDFSYNLRVERSAADVLVSDGNGRRDRLTPQADGSFGADQFFQEGRFNGAGAFTLTFRAGGTWEFLPLDGAPAQGKVRRIADRNGNALTFAYDGLGRLLRVTDTLGRDITLAYHASGFLASVTDFTGRQVRYAYYADGDPGGSLGDLKSVTTPAVTGMPNGHNLPAGKTTTFTYSRGLSDPQLNHNLLTITDPKGQVWMQNTYAGNALPSSLEYDRLVRQVLGAPTNAQTFHYVAQTPDPTNPGPVLKAIHNDRAGHVTEYSYDAANRLVMTREFTGRATVGVTTTETANRPANRLRAGDPAWFETRYEWNPDALCTRIVNAGGNSQENLYRSAFDPNAPRRTRANLRQRTRLPGPAGGDQASITELFEYDTDGQGQGFNVVTRHVDGRGQVTSHSYDARGNRTNTLHRIPGISESWEYNGSGQVTAHTWPDHGSGARRRDEYVYYASGTQAGYLQREIVDARGLALSTTCEYDPAGRVSRVLSPLGQDTLHLVNALDQTVRTWSRELAIGSGLRYQRDYLYDANDNLLSTTQQAPGEALTYTTNTFDMLNRVVLRTRGGLDGVRATEEFSYDANGNLARVRRGQAVTGADPYNLVRYDYDERNRLFREVRAAGHPAQQSTTQFDYDLNGNLSRQAQGMEGAPRRTAHAYDGYNRLVRTTDALGNVTVRAYDANGNTLSERTEGELVDGPGDSGNVRLAETRSDYDAMDRLVRRAEQWFDPATQGPIDDGEAAVTFGYTDSSQLRWQSDDNTNTTTYAYDGAHRLRQVTDAKLNTVTHTHDRNGNIVQTTAMEHSDIAGQPTLAFTTRYAYDALDRLIQTVEPGNITNRLAYDLRDNRVAETNGNGNATIYAYDSLDRLVRTEQFETDTGLGGGAVLRVLRTSQGWDASSRRVRWTDANSNSTLYAYDSLDRLVRTTLADGTTNTASYDRHDNRVGTEDANGTRVGVNFDLKNRVQSVAVAAAPGIVGTTLETYAYDGLSRLVSAANDDAMVSNRHDSLSRLVRQVQFQPGSGGQGTVTFVHDGPGNLLQLGYPGGRIIVRAHDAMNRLSAVGDSPFTPASTLATYKYRGPERLSRRDYGNGTRLDCVYDNARRPVRSEHSSIASGALLAGMGYAWDRNGNKTAATNPLRPEISRTYTYDSLDRLIRSVPEQSWLGTTDYRLDAAGNREQVSGGPGQGSYYMEANWPDPADLQVNQYTTTPSGVRRHDANGNTIEAAGRQYAYDYRNRLVQAQDNWGQTHSFRYDCLGRRVAKVVSGVETRFYYAGDQLIEEQDAGGTTVATYVWGGAPGERITMDRHGNRCFYHEDSQGSPLALTDHRGQSLESYDYDDFGKPGFHDPWGNRIPSSYAQNPWLFQGQRWDVETELYSTVAGYVDPGIGRALSREDDSDPNRFCFGNNPLSAPSFVTGSGGQDEDHSGCDRPPRFECGQHYQWWVRHHGHRPPRPPGPQAQEIPMEILPLPLIGAGTPDHEGCPRPPRFECGQHHQWWLKNHPCGPAKAPAAGTGTGVGGGAARPAAAPCGHRQLLRTVVTPWRFVSSTTGAAQRPGHIPGAVPIRSETWQRDIYNVWGVCTLQKGHAGPHHCVEEWVNAGTITETRTIFRGDAGGPPSKHYSDALPVEKRP